MNPSAAVRDQRVLGEFSLKGMLYGSTIRSPIDRGKVLSVKAPPMPRGYRLILSQDIPGKNRIQSFGTQIPIFADAAVSYKGEAIGLVVGADPALADELAAGVLVECEEEEPFLQWESFASSQVLAKRIARQGDPEKAFATAARIDKGSYRNGSIEHFYSEPMGAAAWWDYDKMAVLCGTQWPYHVRDSVAIALGCDPADISVRPARLGLHLDGKLWYPSLVACQAAVAASVCGVPVKILYTRKEDFLYSPKRARSQIGIRSALDSAGKLKALDIRIVVNVGAYGPLAEEILNQTMLAATGIYACPNVHIEGYAVATNTLPLGALGGLGASHSYFAIEVHLNKVAQALQEDPSDWKAANLLRKGMSLFGSSPVVEEAPYDRIVRRLEALSDYRRKYASYELVRKRDSGKSDSLIRGITLAMAGQGGVFFLCGEGSNSYSLEATLGKDLELELRTSAAVEGEELADLWRLTASEILGLSPEKILIAPADTDRAPNAGPITMSRGVTVVNRLVERCCKAIQKKRFREALPITARSVMRVSSHLRWTDDGLSGTPFESTAWGGAVVEAEIDPRNGNVRPLGVWLVVDGGKTLQKERTLASLRSGTADALGICVSEAFDPQSEGADSYFRYSPLPLSSLPAIHVELLDPDGRAQARGVTELPFDLIPAAFTGAVAQAAGGEPDSLPLNAADILRLLGGK
ncbi:MAG: xanthine dehydrogenase family protein [Rectinemataceae bacterium]